MIVSSRASIRTSCFGSCWVLHPPTTTTTSSGSNRLICGASRWRSEYRTTTCKRGWRFIPFSPRSVICTSCWWWTITLSCSEVWATFRWPWPTSCRCRLGTFGRKTADPEDAGSTFGCARWSTLRRFCTGAPCAVCCISDLPGVISKKDERNVLICFWIFNFTQNSWFFLVFT